MLHMHTVGVGMHLLAVRYGSSGVLSYLKHRIFCMCIAQGARNACGVYDGSGEGAGVWCWCWG